MTLALERWETARVLFDAARALPPDRRSAFLDAACSDAALRSDVERLLRAHAALEGGAAEGFLERLDETRAGALLASGEPAATDLDELAPGAELGRYRIERPLGQGAMGVVYLAHDTRLDRPAALKLLRRHLSLDAEARRRFEEEARAASALDHPNNVTVYDIGDAPDGRLFIAMAYHEGETLRQALTRGPLPVVRAVALARQIAEGLAAAHRRGIVHRDIKPANVLVTTRGVAKVLDFGVAKIAGSALALADTTPGTVAYMSPEQTRGPAVDARSDLWSLGVVLYEMLAGERPFRGDTREAVVTAIRNDERELRYGVDVPAQLKRIVARCLMKDPADRYQTADELLDDLESLHAQAHPVRRRVGLATVTAGSAGLAVLVGFLLVRGPTDRRVSDPATAMAVLPPAPLTSDSALTRLGQDLGITLSTSLDGIGGIQTLSAGSALARTGSRAFSLEEGARLAGRMGAKSLLHGTLMWSGAVVRLDIGLFDVHELTPLARVSVTGSPHDVTALTDSASVRLIKALWSHDQAPVPSLAAVTTGSLPALRAYLDGELAVTRGDYDEAVRSFERAFAFDSTFWLAYWRSLYPRVYEGSRPDRDAVVRLVAHRDRLPDPYRLLLEAFTSESLGSRLRLLGVAATRFPMYWPAWYDYGNSLLHEGPYVGRTYADIRNAFERVVAFNPDFASAWQHLLWTAVRTRDTIVVDNALRHLERSASPTATVSNPANLAYYRTLRGLLRSRGVMVAGAADALANAILRPGVRVPPEITAIDLITMGFPRAQLQLADAVLARRPPSEMGDAHRMGKAFAWATRGAWDSSLVAAAEWVRRSNNPQVDLRAYGLVVVGASVGSIDAETALRWRPSDTRLVTLRTADERAEAAWLDGILAHARGDLPAIAQARQALSTTGSERAGLLAASLDAFHRHASGDVRDAARVLAALEWQIAEGEIGANRLAGPENEGVLRLHPYLSAIHRLAAAAWLLEAGDTLQAARLLTWHEATLAGDPIYARANVSNRLVEPLALYQRARIAEAIGRLREARGHYEGFVERYDLPPAHHEPWVASARAALRRLSSGNR